MKVKYSKKQYIIDFNKQCIINLVDCTSELSLNQLKYKETSTHITVDVPEGSAQQPWFFITQHISIKR